MNKTKTDGTILIKQDPWLEPYREALKFRFEQYNKRLHLINSLWGSLKDFANAYKYYGITVEKGRKNIIKGFWYREWAPEASQLFLTGDFNDWNRVSHPLIKDDRGIWQIFLPYKKYSTLFTHKSKFKVRVIGGGKDLDRIPAYVTRVIQDPISNDFAAQVWLPEEEFCWTDSDKNPPTHSAYKIYEAHIGMAVEEERVGTYKEFTKNVIPRIVNGGYNTIQLMAVQEHPYYGSFGYHVSNFFAPSSRFGTPEDLKELVNTAHNNGLTVVMDLVHSHACKNILEGINEFDGTDYQYFHAGPKGEHSLWDSKLFNYDKIQVLEFLLSNVKYWIEEFHFDGFRFDGVTSMLYTHHGHYYDFDHYDKYFNDVDLGALTYLKLANNLIHDLKPEALSIAEDVSGMPGLCRPLEEGGIGFDYRLATGVPDYWIKILKHKSDDEWDINEIWGVLSNRRHEEKHISYVESHDQALVGDKTIAFWLMGKEMYYHMTAEDQNIVIDRGIALHKMIRFISILLGGEGYLNFMGNEFGHPEWIDFPREGNGWSYKYARRQWSLVDKKELKYRYLAEFDKDMLSFMDKYNLFNSMVAQQINMDHINKTMIFERNNLIFIFNFHPTTSFPGYRCGVPSRGQYNVVFCSDDIKYGGHGRIDKEVPFHCEDIGCHNRPYSIVTYIPNRTAMVLKNFKTKY